MKKEQFIKILKEIDYICKSVNEEIISKNPKSKLRYEVLQFSEIAKKWNSTYKIADFYNQNWRGNVDFMHIPNFKQVIENCLNYPIIIAREEESQDILAISTIKYDENTGENVDPYFPEKDAKYFSITGVLVERGAPYRGMGKRIYEIAVRGAHEYNKEHPGTRIMCVIDCRNKHSMQALASAVENINNNEIYGENKELPVSIVGYYELKNSENNALEEAPTIVVEVGLNEREKKEKSKNTTTIEYSKQNRKSLFDSLKDELREKLSRYGINKPINGKDGESIVSYYPLDKEFSLIETDIISNGTEQGNDRKPIYDEYMHKFMGPVRPISVDDTKEEER